MMLDEHLQRWCNLRGIGVNGFDSVTATFYAGAAAMAEIYITHASDSRLKHSLSMSELTEMEQYARECLHERGLPTKSTSDPK